MSQTPFNDNSSELFSPTFSVTPCMLHSSSLSLLTAAPHLPQAQPMPLPVTYSSTQSYSLTSSCSNSLKLFSPIPTNSLTKNKWPSPPSTIHTSGDDTIYVIMQVTNESYEVHSSVCIPPPNTSTHWVALVLAEAVCTHVHLHHELDYKKGCQIFQTFHKACTSSS